ncbi:MAG: hypothetical protein M3Q29_17470 [Chloroflexota bacterium]|nr:hypothetical protein [Chloroflexota bacterium]
MTRLLEALRALGLEVEVDPSGRWVKVRGEQCRVYIYQASWDGGYYTWCDDPGERTVEFYPDVAEAIQAGLRRSARRTAAKAVDTAAMRGVVSS